MSENTPAGAPRLAGLGTRLLGLAAIQSDRRVSEQLARAGARKWHYAVLATLADFGPASQAQLSERAGIYRSDLVSVINELNERGLVERSPNPADRRQNLVTLTRMGQRHLLALDTVIADVQDDVFAPLSPREREHLIRMLTTLVTHHGQTM